MLLRTMATIRFIDCLKKRIFPISSHDLELVEFFVNSDDAKQTNKRVRNLRVFRV